MRIHVKPPKPSEPSSSQNLITPTKPKPEDHKFSRTVSAPKLLSGEIHKNLEGIPSSSSTQLSPNRKKGKKSKRTKRDPDPNLTLSEPKYSNKGTEIDDEKSYKASLDNSIDGRLGIKITMLWDDYIISLNGDYSQFKRSKMLNELIRNFGIPPPYRSLIWPRITNSYQLYESNKRVYSAIIKKRVERHLNEEHQRETDPTRDGPLYSSNPYHRQIELDLPRTFPNSAWFNTPEVQNIMRRLLHAYTWFKPEVGYCQAMNFLAAMMLFYVEEEMVFWMIGAVMDYILPAGYYSENLIGIKVDIKVFKLLFEQRFPKLSKHFQSMTIEPQHFVINWFMCLFITVFPDEICSRFLDAFFYDGSKMLFQVALALFRLNEKSLLSTKDNAELLLLCKELPQTIDDAGTLLNCAYEFELSGKKLDELRRETRKGLQRT